MSLLDLEYQLEDAGYRQIEKSEQKIDHIIMTKIVFYRYTDKEESWVTLYNVFNTNIIHAENKIIRRKIISKLEEIL